MLGRLPRPPRSPGRRPPRTLGNADNSYDDTCPAALRSLWEGLLADVGAAVLRLGTDAGGNRFFAGDVGLHAGTGD